MISPEPYYNDDLTSFAYPSARERWPVILVAAIDDLSRTIAKLTGENNKGNGGDAGGDADSTAGSIAAKISEGKKLIAQIEEINYNLQHDRRIAPFAEEDVKKFGRLDLGVYNTELAKLVEPRNHWLHVPWLFSECYLYRDVVLRFQKSSEEYWRQYDIFGNQKLDAFKSSGDGVYELAVQYKEVSREVAQLLASQKPGAGRGADTAEAQADGIRRTPAQAQASGNSPVVPNLFKRAL